MNVEYPKLKSVTVRLDAPKWLLSANGRPTAIIEGSTFEYAYAAMNGVANDLLETLKVIYGKDVSVFKDERKEECTVVVCTKERDGYVFNAAVKEHTKYTILALPNLVISGAAPPKALPTPLESLPEHFDMFKADPVVEEQPVVDIEQPQETEQTQETPVLDSQ